MNQPKPRAAACRPKEQAVLLPTRPQGTVTCPHCWTAQRAERDVCYRCATRFVYLDEMGREASQGA